jgi:hypothetical protein
MLIFVDDVLNLNNIESLTPIESFPKKVTVKSLILGS